MDNTSRFGMSAPTWNDLGKMLLAVPLFLVFFCVACPFRGVSIMPPGRLLLQGLAVLLIAFYFAVSLAGFIVSIWNLGQCLLSAAEDAVQGFYALRERYLAYAAM